MKSFLYSLHETVPPHLGQTVKMRSVGILKQCASSQFLTMPVRHAVTQYNQVFHNLKNYKIILAQAHDIGKDTGCRHTGSRAIALDEHGVFLITFCGEQHHIVASFEHIERMVT